MLTFEGQTCSGGGAFTSPLMCTFIREPKPCATAFYLCSQCSLKNPLVIFSERARPFWPGGWDSFHSRNSKMYIQSSGMRKNDPHLACRHRAMPGTSEISSRAGQKVRTRHLTGDHSKSGARYTPLSSHVQVALREVRVLAPDFEWPPIVSKVGIYTTNCCTEIKISLTKFLLQS